MANTQDYVALVTGQHQDKPKFAAVIEALTAGFVDINNVNQSNTTIFDLDTATGSALDWIGHWIGITRYLEGPLVGVYFEWDGLTVLTGWDSGSWKADLDPDAGVTILPDDAYRSLLKAVAVANSWDGTIPTAATTWDAIFADQFVVIQDNQDMTLIIGFVGPPLTAVQQALLVGGYVPLKPVGVRVAYYAVPINDGPIFGWDVESELFAGWDSGSWPQLLSS